MARPPNADGQRTRQAILDAALALFAEKGFFGTSLRDVAGAVGVRESALYNYFPGKEALFEALLVADSALKSEQLSAILETPAADGRELLERLADLTLDRFMQPRQQQLFLILMSDGMRLAREGRINLLERMGSSRQELQDLMRRLMAAGCLRDEDPELLVMQFLGPLLFWRQLHAVGATSAAVLDRRAFVRAHINHFLNGAAAHPEAVPVGARRTVEPAIS
jgi:AcrR family transcriptional regulator